MLRPPKFRVPPVLPPQLHALMEQTACTPKTIAAYLMAVVRIEPGRAETAALRIWGRDRKVTLWTALRRYHVMRNEDLPLPKKPLFRDLARTGPDIVSQPVVSTLRARYASYSAEVTRKTEVAKRREMVQARAAEIASVYATHAPNLIFGGSAGAQPALPSRKRPNEDEGEGRLGKRLDRRPEPSGRQRVAAFAVSLPAMTMPRQGGSASGPSQQAGQSVRVAIAAAASPSPARAARVEHAPMEVDPPITELAPPPDAVEPPEGPLPCLADANVMPRPHQVALAKHLLSHRGAIAAHSVGTGKTLLAVCAAETLMAMVPTLRRTVVLAPLSLLQNFRDAIAQFGANPARYTIVTPQTFHNQYKDDPRIVDRLANAFFVVDEAHELRTTIKIRGKNKQGLVAHAALQAAARARRVLLLTATPMVNRASDIRNLVAMVRGDRVPISERGFRELAQSPAELRRYCGGIFSFVGQGRFGSHFPAEIKRPVNLVMTVHEYVRYRAIELEQQRIMGRSGYIKNPRVFLMGLRMAANMVGMAESMADVARKADYIGETIAALPPGRRRRSIVFSAFLGKGVDIVQAALDARGITHRIITGEVSSRDRATRVGEFNGPDPPDVMILSAAGGQGLDFQRVRHVFLFEPAWNVARLEQAAGRAIRFQSHVDLPPDEQDVTVHELLVDKDPDMIVPNEAPSVDRILREIMDEKREEIVDFTQRLKSIALK